MTQRLCDRDAARDSILALGAYLMLAVTPGGSLVNASDIPAGSNPHDAAIPISNPAAASESAVHIATAMQRSPTFAFPPSSDDSIQTLISRQDYKKALEEARKVIKQNPERPNGYNLLGAAYLGLRDINNARASFTKALSLDKDNVAAQMNLAELDLSAKNFASAQQRYQQVLAKEPKNTSALLGMGRLEAARGNDAKGVEWIQRAKAADPTALEPRMLLAANSMLASNYPAALDELREAQRNHPNDPRLLSLLGQAEFATGQKELAISAFKQVVALQPKSPSAYYRLGVAEASVGHASAAAEHLKKALELKPDFDNAVNALAVLELNAGRPSEALRLARQFQGRAPKVPEGYVLEGDILAAQKQYREAVAAYEKARALRETSLLTVKLHTALANAGDRKEADTRLQRWLTAHPEDVAARQYLAADYQRRDMKSQAIEQYVAVLDKQPKNVIALNNLANLYQSQGNPRALDMAESAYKLAPESAAVVDTLGWILIQQGNTVRGLDLLRKAVALAPQDREIRFHLASALAKSGEKAKARDELEKLLSGTEQFPQRQQAEALFKQL